MESQIEKRVEGIGKTEVNIESAVLAHSSDKSVFIKHGEIQDENLRLKLDFIRDINNKLGLLTFE